MQSKINSLIIHCTAGMVFFVFAAIAPVHAVTLNLLPDIPYYGVNTNPHVATMWNSLLVSNPAVTIDFKTADEVRVAAYAYCYGQSPYYQNQAALTRLLSLLDAFLTAWDQGQRLNDMMYSSQATQAYMMLKTYYPDKIPADRKAAWENGISRQCQSVLAKTDLYYNYKVGALWLNGDIRLAIGLYFGGIILSNPDWEERGRRVVEEVIPLALLGDGGTHYVGYQNESPCYHSATKQFLLAWHIVRPGSPVTNLLLKMGHYSPMSQHDIGMGFVEYTTSPSWKQYYNRSVLYYTAAMDAYLTGDQNNWALGKDVRAFDLAFIYRPGLTGKPLPDNFVLDDRNILGPRARFGPWGYVGTLRDPYSPLPELTEVYLSMDGKNAFAGAYILDTNPADWDGGDYPLNAAFNGPAPEVKLRTGLETDWGRGNVNAFLTTDEKNSITKGRILYGMTTRYKISERRFKPCKWEGMQQWVLTPTRLIGMIEMEAMQNDSIYGLDVRIPLVSGRKSVTGTKKTLTVVDKYTYEYGKLRVKIHDEDFGGDVRSRYFGIMNDPLDTYSVMLEMHDASDLGNDTLISYSQGTRRFVLVESTYAGQSYASAAAHVQTGNTNLVGFEFEETGRKIRMIHNISASPQVYASAMSCPFTMTRLMKSWTINTVDSQPITNGNVSVSVTIPAYGHVLIVNSDIAEDHLPGHHTYETVFEGKTIWYNGDLNFDGRVDLLDLVELARGWLKCTNPKDIQCDNQLSGN
jgi:hypothetical protein